MKHLKTFESSKLLQNLLFNYTIDDIYHWWSGINVTENDDYYILDLSNIYLTNKIIQLNSGLKDKTINFYCKNHIVNHELKLERAERVGNELIFHTVDHDTHSVNINKPIKISKIQINVDKYNL